ncbi:MAG: hypothetical protein ACR2OF_00635 [Hyphomicrobium sp.]
MSDKFILDGKKVVPEPDLTKWSQWYEKAREERIVAKTNVGDMNVSTVFLGLDHSFGDGPPLLFETMIFGGPEDQEYQERCSTWEQAEQMHERGVQAARELLN